MVILSLNFRSQLTMFFISERTKGAENNKRPGHQTMLWQKAQGDIQKGRETAQNKCKVIAFAPRGMGGQLSLQNKTERGEKRGSAARTPLVLSP